MRQTSVRIILVGATGRMGRLIDACASEDRSVEIVERLGRANLREFMGKTASRGTGSPPPADVAVDFSGDAGTRAAIGLATTLGMPLMTGTTGLSEATVAALTEAAKKIAVLPCSNTSLGVAVLRRLVAEAARLLGEGYDLDILESHHRRKLDAPSGTALSLAASLADAGCPVPADRIHSLRGGDVVGQHEVVFAGPGETIRLEHRAERRELFALGALRAAKWLVGRPAGRYRIEDTLEGLGRA